VEECVVVFVFVLSEWGGGNVDVSGGIGGWWDRWVVVVVVGYVVGR
jgi:hypothetical protein